MSRIDKEYYDNGIIESEEYRNDDNEKHRIDGPAVIIYNKNGDIKMELYYVNDIFHRENGPAYINYNFLHGGLIYGWAFNNKVYSSKVKEWIKENNFKSYEEMNKEDFDRMWFEIL